MSVNLKYAPPEVTEWARTALALHGSAKKAAEMTGMTVATILRLAAGAHVRSITLLAVAAAMKAQAGKDT